MIYKQLHMSNYTQLSPYNETIDCQTSNNKRQKTDEDADDEL